MLFFARIFEKSWNCRGAEVGRWLLAMGCLALTAGGCGSTAGVVQDFTLAVTPASVALTAGGSTQQITVTSTAVSGYSAQIAIAISGLPAGVTANPAAVDYAGGYGDDYADGGDNGGGEFGDGDDHGDFGCARA